MEFKKTLKECKGIKLSLEKDSKEIARATLYVMSNDLHNEPFGLLEDVMVDEELRGQGIGTELVKSIIEEAKKENCYKVIATSRHAR